MQAKSGAIPPPLLVSGDFLSGSIVPRTVKLADHAYDRIKTMLLEGGLRPGDKLSVIELGRKLECSRVPVMEAMKRLEAEGFVDIVPQVGCRVVQPEVANVADFFELFAVTEALVAGLAARRRTAADCDEFRKLCGEIGRRLESAGAPPQRDPTHRQLNLLYHRQIHRMARAPEPSRIAAGLWDRSDFYICIAFGALYFSRRVRMAHRAVREAILAGDADAAEAAMRIHLKAVGVGVTAALQKQSDRVRRE